MHLLESPVCWSKPTHEGEWSKKYKIQDSQTKRRETLATEHQDEPSNYIEQQNTAMNYEQIIEYIIKCTICMYNINICNIVFN